jgi:hypothetical protein
MTRDDLATAFRKEIDDTVRPYLWSDDEVDSYMDEAQNMFVRLTGGIKDATSSLCEVSVSAGDVFISYDPRILKIRHAQRSDGKELSITDLEDHQDAGTQPRLDNNPGALLGLVLGVDDNNIRLRPIPASADTVSLVLLRLPLALDLSEIPAQHQRCLIDWMKYLAFSKQDAETVNETKASQFMDAFVKYCMKTSEESRRRHHKAGTVTYGGI